MAKCAKEIIQQNNYEDQISIVPKRSDKLRVGIDGDLKKKPNLLVAELFDTELIGEGALHSYRHAIKHLLSADALCVPSKSRIYIQLVQSEMIYKWHQFFPVKVNEEIQIVPSKTVVSCEGSNILHDLQINQLKYDQDFKVVSEPKVIFEFDFTDYDSLKLEEHKIIEFEIIKNIEGPISVFMWWDLDMDYQGEIVLSCAPFWARKGQNSSKNIPWRDHWMQAIYYLPFQLARNPIKTGEKIKIGCHHDDYSLWFNEIKENLETFSKPSICRCGIHSYLSRSRLGLINDQKQLQLYHKAINESFNQNLQDKKALFLGDQSLIPFLLAHNKQITKVVCLAKENHIQRFYQEFSNDYQDKIEIIRNLEDIKHDSFDLIIGEPYFNSSDLPWHHLHFWYLISQIKQNISMDKTVLMPKMAKLKCIPIEFDDLWKIRSEVGNDVEGFNLSEFDKLIQKAISLSDAVIESHFLWEYSGKAISNQPILLFTFDFEAPINFNDKFSCEFSLDINFEGKSYFAIVFWVEYFLTENIIINTGPVDAIQNGEYIEWNKNWKQGLTFVKKKAKKSYEFTSIFNGENGEINLLEKM